MTLRNAYWRIADAFTFPLALIAALGAIENSYAYGALGAWLAGETIADYSTCEAE